jgi:hypothetical protein
MKDIRGTHAAQVRSAVLRTFRLPTLTSTNRKKNAKEVLAWKKSDEVRDAYTNLFENEMINKIAEQAFSSIIAGLSNPDDDLYYELCVYTAAICDIILNPDYPDVECARKPLELRLRKFKVFPLFEFWKIN